MDLNCASGKMSVCWWCTVKIDFKDFWRRNSFTSKSLVPPDRAHPPPSWTVKADAMPCCKTQSPWFAVFFCFVFVSFVWIFSLEKRETFLGNSEIILAGVPLWRERVNKATVFRPSLAWLDWRQPMGKANFVGRAHRNQRRTALPWKMYNRTLVFQFSQLY